MAVNYKELKENGFMRQKQKDRFSMRLKVVGGNLTSEQMMKAVAISEKYGIGRMHLTSRQSMEIPYIKLEDIDSVRADLKSSGLEGSVCGPGVRTITACQGNEICASGCIDTYGLAVELSERYSGRKLPHKFKIGITGCMNNCLKAEENDLGIKGGYSIEWLAEPCTLCGVCIKVCREKALSKSEGKIMLNRDKCIHCGRCVKACPFDAWKGQEGYILSFAGTFGNRIAKGEQILPIIHEKETLFRVADAALDFFDQHAKPRERFRTALDRGGWEDFKKALETAYQGKAV